MKKLFQTLFQKKEVKKEKVQNWIGSPEWFTHIEEEYRMYK